MRRATIFRRLAEVIQARETCRGRMEADDADVTSDAYKTASDWFDRHKAHGNGIVGLLPSGSGIDCGTALDWAASKPNRLVFIVSFHHMDGNGGYDGWTEHSIIVTPDLASSFELRITGRDRNEIKEYLAETYDSALRSDIVETHGDVRLWREGMTGAECPACKRVEFHDRLGTYPDGVKCRTCAEGSA